MNIIAIEGIDKAGKETMAKMLAEFLRNRGYRVVEDAFPRYHTPIGKKIKQALYGEITMPDVELAKLYEIDRYFAQEEWFALDVEEEIDFLILDRYTMSNMVFGRAKGLSETELLWLQHGLQKADLHIVVDISVEESLRRGQNYETVDLNETNVELLQKVRDLQLEYAEEGTYYGTGEVIRVNGEQDKQFVHRDVVNAVMHHSSLPVFVK